MDDDDDDDDDDVDAAISGFWCPCYHGTFWIKLWKGRPSFLQRQSPKGWKQLAFRDAAMPYLEAVSWNYKKSNLRGAAQQNTPLKLGANPERLECMTYCWLGMAWRTTPHKANSLNECQFASFWVEHLSRSQLDDIGRTSLKEGCSSTSTKSNSTWCCCRISTALAASPNRIIWTTEGVWRKNICSLAQAQAAFSPTCEIHWNSCPRLGSPYSPVNPR